MIKNKIPIISHLISNLFPVNITKTWNPAIDTQWTCLLMANASSLPKFRYIGYLGKFWKWKQKSSLLKDNRSNPTKDWQ